MPIELQTILPTRVCFSHPQHGGQLEYRFEYRMLKFAAQDLKSRNPTTSSLCSADLLARLVLHDNVKDKSTPREFALSSEQFVEHIKVYSGISFTVFHQQSSLRVAGDKSYEAQRAIVKSRISSTADACSRDIEMNIRSWGASRPYSTKTRSVMVCGICNAYGHMSTSCCEKEGVCRVTISRLVYHQNQHRNRVQHKEDSNDPIETMNKMLLPIEPILPADDVFRVLFPVL